MEENKREPYNFLGEAKKYLEYCRHYEKSVNEIVSKLKAEGKYEEV